MPPPIPRCSSWAYSSLISPSHFSLPRYGSRVGLHIVLFEACSAFTRVAACPPALPPIRDPLIEGFSHFVTSMTAPIASGWSDCRVGLAPTGKRRLCTAHTRSRHQDTTPLASANHVVGIWGQDAAAQINRRLAMRHSMPQKRPSTRLPARVAPLGLRIKNSEPQRLQVRRRRSSELR